MWSGGGENHTWWIELSVCDGWEERRRTSYTRRRERMNVELTSICVDILKWFGMITIAAELMATRLRGCVNPVWRPGAEGETRSRLRARRLSFNAASFTPLQAELLSYPTHPFLDERPTPYTNSLYAAPLRASHASNERPSTLHHALPFTLRPRPPERHVVGRRVAVRVSSRKEPGQHERARRTNDRIVLFWRDDRQRQHARSSRAW